MAVDHRVLDNVADELKPGDVEWDADQGRFKALVEQLRMGDCLEWGGLPLPDPKKPGFDALVEKLFSDIAQQRTSRQPLLPATGGEHTDTDEPGGGALVRAAETGEAGGAMESAQEPARAASGVGGIAEVATRLNKALGATPVDEATALQALEELKNFESPDGKTLKKTGAPLPPPVELLHRPPVHS